MASENRRKSGTLLSTRLKMCMRAMLRKNEDRKHISYVNMGDIQKFYKR
jgi:hypothetical protein